MKLNLSPLTVEQFLAEYWQQKPIIIKGGFADFQNPLAPDELAGLAAEPNIESRVVWQADTGWKAQSGPFTDYDEYGNSHWSLVVQSVNHWIPAVQEFARHFDFIPQWRFDDVMVSFAAAGGGVGPHVDNYDVFICQGSGQRRWRIGAYKDYEETIAHDKLLHVKPFNAIIDETVSAGDIVYIPPGYPHEGKSLNESMSFSVGYKSTNATELLSGFADYLIDFDKSPALLDDKQRNKSRYGQLDKADFKRLQRFIQSTLSDEDKFSEFLGIHYSQSTSELDIAQDEYTFEAWLSQFTKQPLHKLYALKALYLENTIDQGIFYLDGERHQLQSINPQLIRRLCDDAVITMDLFAQHPNSETALHWLWQSTNRGYWYFE